MELGEIRKLFLFATFRLFFILLLFLSVDDSEGLKVLIQHPYGTGSHVKTLLHVTDELIKRGHTVTTIRMADENDFPERGPNHTMITLPFDNSDGELPYVTPKGAREARFVSPLSELSFEANLSLLKTLSMLDRPHVLLAAYCRQLLENWHLLEDQEFDVAIVDLLYNECGLALARSLGAPVIGFWGQSFTGQEADLTVADLNPSTVPFYTTQNGSSMDFIQRAYNSLLKAFMWAMTVSQCLFCDWIIQEYLKGVPSSLEMIGELNGFLINSHNILDTPRLQPKTFVNVGGLQIKRELDPLPEDIKEFLEDADQGVMLLALGFLFDPGQVPKERMDNLMEALGSMPQKVIARFPTRPKNAPPNLMTRPWLPQQEILAHPKTILFFTHFGMHGVLEAIWYGVPMVGFPLFSDQGDVRTKAEEKGVAKGVDMFASADEIFEAIVQVRDDPSYTCNAKRLSSVYRSHIRHPMDDAIWLIEYIGDTGGARHLLHASRKLNFLQYYSLDILAFVTLVAVALFKIFSFIRSKSKTEAPSPR